ncbi:MAG TPA: hypothetical protein VMT74_00875 [Gaiellaceae bacterium]|nr:hypothetical protein [Gaiellaceae bacterium]
MSQTEIALDGRVVTGTGFLPGERVTVIAGGVSREATAGPDGAFRLELATPRTVLWIRADGDRGSSATLAVPLAKRLS